MVRRSGHTCSLAVPSRRGGAVNSHDHNRQTHRQSDRHVVLQPLALLHKRQSGNTGVPVKYEGEVTGSDWFVIDVTNTEARRDKHRSAQIQFIVRG